MQPIFTPPIEQHQMNNKPFIKQAIIGCTMLSFVCSMYLQYQISTDMTMIITSPLIEGSIQDLRVLPDVNVVKQLIKVILNIVS
jgi:hypothetical protein